MLKAFEKIAAPQDELETDEKPREPSGDKDKKKVKAGGPTSPTTSVLATNFPR